MRKEEVWQVLERTYEQENGAKQKARTKKKARLPDWSEAAKGKEQLV